MRSFVTWLFRHGRRPARATAPRTNRTILGLTHLESRETPALMGFTATGAAAGASPIVTVARPDGSTLAQITAYDSAFLGGVNTAIGEIDSDPNTVEVVTGAGPGGGPHVKVFSVDTTTGTVKSLGGFMAYNVTFAGGVNVALGMFDPAVNRMQVVTGAGPGGGPHVRIFSLNNDGSMAPFISPLVSFMAYNINFHGGVNVAAGELDGNTANGDELVVAAGPGGGPHVRVFRTDGTEFASFMAFPINYSGGIRVGSIAPRQLTIDALAGGGVTAFAFSDDGTISSTVITPM
jgi:hypothetical protein